MTLQEWVQKYADFFLKNSAVGGRPCLADSGLERTRGLGPGMQFILTPSALAFIIEDALKKLADTEAGRDELIELLVEAIEAGIPPNCPELAQDRTRSSRLDIDSVSMRMTWEALAIDYLPSAIYRRMCEACPELLQIGNERHRKYMAA